MNNSNHLDSNLDYLSIASLRELFKLRRAGQDSSAEEFTNDTIYHAYNRYGTSFAIPREMVQFNLGPTQEAGSFIIPEKELEETNMEQ